MSSGKLHETPLRYIKSIVSPFSSPLRSSYLFLPTRIISFWFQPDNMFFLVLKTHDFRLERRTIPQAWKVNQRCSAQLSVRDTPFVFLGYLGQCYASQESYDSKRLICPWWKECHQLDQFDLEGKAYCIVNRGIEEAERMGSNISPLRTHGGEIDGIAIQSRWCACLQASKFESGSVERSRKSNGRVIAKSFCREASHS